MEADMDDDSIKLLRECDAGIKMAISSIDEILENVSDEKMKKILRDSKAEHRKLEQEAEEYLNQYQEPEKEPAAMAKAMSWFKTNMKMVMDESDATVADLITDGCHMGIKSVHRYLNQYPSAEGKIRKLAENLVDAQEKLLKDMRAYL
ncbi:MAG: hypothetical protein J6B06_01660 [Lachnospiraceae bacterium]|nr:hypothetical protein [Lachnospiraceae bacterium]